MRRIIHVDMDAFYAAVEQIDCPDLAGKPVIVGGDLRRGVVSSASYEARSFGVKSAMPMAQAVKLCPNAIVIKPHMRRYKEVSEKIFEILLSFTPLVEPLSLDEAFLDVTGSEKLFGPAEQIAQQIKARIKNELGLSCSIGIAPNKFLAKLASDLKKPDGFVVVREDEIEKFLKDLPVSKLWGVGKATEQKLQQMGISTIGALRELTHVELIKRFGKMGSHLYALARGIDERPVVPERKAKSISRETTFLEDIYDPETLKGMLFELTEEVAAELREEDLLARTVQIKIRFADFKTITRSSSFKQVTNVTELLWREAEKLFDEKVDLHRRGVRLVGVGVSNLTRAEAQLPLFKEQKQARLEKLDKTVDELRKKFGEKIIERGWPF